MINTTSGVTFYLDQANTHLQHLRMDSLDVSGYQKSGALIGSWNGTSGFSDVRITNSRFHANGEAGLSSYQFFPLQGQAHHNWYVGNCEAYDNSGRANITHTHTGNGIVLAGIDGVIVERCKAYNNGWLNGNTAGGPVGIWGWACNNLVIQLCESHHNQSGTGIDGGGFDLDGGCTNSVMQYNYSHDNQGAGYLLAQFPDAAPMHDLIVRYNISENDARGHNQGALAVWSSGANGGIARASFHNNTVLMSPPANGTRPRAVYIMSGGISDITLRNNVLQTSGGLPVLTTLSAAGLRLEGNCYWSADAPLTVEWGGTAFPDLQTWRAATGQEQLANGNATGLNADPLLARSATAAPLATSPVKAAGLNLQAEFSISPGPRDFIGNPTVQAPARGNIGAFEGNLTSVAAPLPVELTAFTAEQDGNGAMLRWTTATEKDNAYFVVESSTNGQTFTALHQVHGQGNSSRAQHYQYADQNVTRYAANTVYYRLRQVDTDGKSTYSPVRTLSARLAARETRLHVWPNPAQPGNVVRVQGEPATQAHLFDAQGRLLASALVAADGIAGLPADGLAPGVYVVRCGLKSTRLTLTN
ncbi:right-handed parallel beta-helix repeat-containing protein [Hymenobacter arizonensis]|nr:right-handed parallel beta-helix repeat-containing protein [Hymenobacter arizonensis]